MDRQQWLYRFYAFDGTLLYIGVTQNGEERWAHHRRHAKWWAQVARRTIQQYSTREDVLLAERHAIYREKPVYNVVHNRAGHRLYGSEPIPDSMPLSEEAHRAAALDRIRRAFYPEGTPLERAFVGPAQVVSLDDWRARRRSRRRHGTGKVGSDASRA